MANNSPASSDQSYCPVCDKSIATPADGVCPDCGVALAAAPSDDTQPLPSGLGCPVCGEPVADDATICDSCGVNLAEARAVVNGASGVASPSSTVATGAMTVTECPICGAPVPLGATHCDGCGIDLSQASAVLGRAATAPGAAAGAADAPNEQCPNCGAPRRTGAAFCRECGEPYPRKIATEGLLSAGEFLSGRYRVERRLGGGGMGAVYLAQDMNLRGKPVAIKAVLNSQDPDLLKAARREAENLLGIDHPNIVTLRDIADKGQIPFIIMDYLEGPDWSDLYERKFAATGEAFTAEEALSMIVGILPAFDYLHHRTPPVVYRDFKPSQVKLVRQAGTQLDRHVLLDLGVAYAYEGQPVEAWGTAGYAPPEIGGVCLQPPSMDLACLCRTLQALMGIDPMKFGYGELPSQSDIPWVPDELYYLLERGTAKDPRRRFQTLDDLRPQLEGVLRLIQGRAGTLPRPAGAFHTPVMSQLFAGGQSRTTGALLALPVPQESDPAADLLTQANEMLLQGKSAEALQQLEAALRVNPQSQDAKLLRTVALAQSGETEAAQRSIAQLSQGVSPNDDWRLAMVAAQVAEDANEPKQAESLYRNIIRMVPGELPPRQKLANLLLSQGRNGEAAAVYEQIVGADPANVEAVLNWADALASLGRTDDSINVLRRVGENAVRYVDAQMRMVDLLLQRSQQNDGAALSMAAEALESLQGRTQGPRYQRLLGDWWFAAYQLGLAGQLAKIDRWPFIDAAPPAMKVIADQARRAYYSYVRTAPTEADLEDVIGRIHFGIKELM